MSENKTLERKIGADVNRAPLVSVIIPAYSAADFIRETLDSVIRQTSQNYEIILINDGSPDTARLEEILEDYFEKIIYLKQENGGTASARNTGIENASGEFLAFLDGDDVWLPQYLELQLAALNQKKCDLIYCDATFFGSVRDSHKTFMKKSPSRGIVTTESLLGAICNVITSGTVVKREKVVASGMFDETLPRIGMEDFDLWFRLAQTGTKLCYQKKVLLRYRVRPNSLSGSNVERAERELIALDAIEQKYDLSEREENALKNQRRRASADLEIEKGKHNLVRENYEAARGNILAANRHHRRLKLTMLTGLLTLQPQWVKNLYQLISPSEYSFVSHGGESNQEITAAPQKSSLKAQSAWLLFAKVFGYSLTIILPLLIVRFLNQEKVGTYRESFQVIANVSSILPLGFSMSAYYFLARETTRRGAAIFNILIFNFAVGALAFLTLFFYPQLLGNIFQNEELTRLAPLIGIVIWLWLFSAFLETAAIANEEAKLATVFIIFTQLGKTVLMAAAVTIFSTVESIIYAALIQSAIQTIILLLYLNSRFPGFWRKLDFKFFREQCVYAIPFGLIAILYTVQNDIHNYFVGYRFSAAEYAVYAYGCFQLPLIFMLSESVTSVLIPRISQLQLAGDKDEIIRLTARAMQKLALFYFPLYIFFFITAPTFIITLFGEAYAASIPIFRINLTFLPFLILITDPIVRAYQDLSRVLLVVRIFLLCGLIAALFFGIRHFDLSGMIAIVLVVYLIEKVIAETIILRRIGVGRRHLFLLGDILKTAVIAAGAGVAAYLAYLAVRNFMPGVGANISQMLFSTPKPSLDHFLDGGLLLFAAGLIFAPLYFAGAYYWNLIDAEEKRTLHNWLDKLKSFFKKNMIKNQESQI